MMTTEERAITALKALPLHQQEEVLHFIEFLRTKLRLAQTPDAHPAQSSALAPKAPLGERLQMIRQRAIANGMQPLILEEVEQEMAEQRDRHCELWAE